LLHLWLDGLIEVDRCGSMRRLVALANKSTPHASLSRRFNVKNRCDFSHKCNPESVTLAFRWIFLEQKMMGK
jgi:hypothetical protein